MAEEEAVEGAFVASLKRNNKQIKSDRAAAIAEDAEMTFRRYIEDLDIKIKRLHRDLENMLDMSPENSQSLILGKNFDAIKYVEQEAEIGFNIRQNEIKLEIARNRYNFLFGGNS